MNTNDLGPVLDSNGQPVNDADVLTLAFEEKVFDVTFNGLTYKVKGQRNGATHKLVSLLANARRAAQVHALFVAGFTDKDREIGGVLHEDSPNDDFMLDPRYEAFANAASADNAEVWKASANLAAACILATNVPQLRDKESVTGADLLACGEVGKAIIEAVLNFTQSSQRDSKARGESETPEASESATPTKASGKAKSRITPDSKTPKPPTMP